MSKQVDTVLGLSFHYRKTENEGIIIHYGEIQKWEVMEKNGRTGKGSGGGTESPGLDRAPWVGSGCSAALQTTFLSLPAATTIPLSPHAFYSYF